MNNINVKIECKNPQILIVTPLLPNHSISGITKKTIKRNDIPFYWLTSSGNYNIPTNAQKGIDWYKNRFGKLPPYYIMIDRDIELGRRMLDRLYMKLDAFKSFDKVGFAYATFQFKGHVERDFPAISYDINKLVESNYISSNSLFKSDVIEKVGLVTNDKYKRLLDWAFLLKCFSYDIIGVPEPTAWFIAHSTENDISAGSVDDYKLKYKRVYDDFIKPLFEKSS